MTGTFVGMPAFPSAARQALADTQVRRNLAHATSTIRAKRAAVVAELEEEQVGEADFFVATSPSDEDNVMTCLQAHNIGASNCLTIIHPSILSFSSSDNVCMYIFIQSKPHTEELQAVSRMA